MKHETSRRDFLKALGMGAAAAGIVGYSHEAHADVASGSGVAELEKI